MKLIAWFRSVGAKFFRRSETVDDVDEELRSHIQYRADDLERTGLTRVEAERRARIEFGGYQRYKEESHEALGGNFLETLLQDVRQNLRALRKSPGFTVAAVATLALAIGANAVVFGIMDGLVLRPVNVPHPDSLWAIEHFESYPNYIDLRDRNRSFDRLAAWKMVFTGLDTGNDPAGATGYATSGNYFDVLELQPSLGRFFHSSDEHGPGSAPYIVLTWAYWHTRFHDDPGVVGRTVQLSKHPFTIIGVAPRGFYGTLLFGGPDFFMPIVNQEQVDGQDLLNARADVQGIFETLGHLKPGVTPAQAATDLKSVAAYL
jgi:hypothetical protein